MKYIALLRGINVGGKSSVSMPELKKAFEKAGYTNVRTYINSGNIVFESHETDAKKISFDIDTLLQKTFFAIKSVVLSHKDVQAVMEHVPDIWKHNDLRKYIVFVKHPAKPEDVIKEAHIKEGIDAIDKGPGVVYMSTKMGGITKSGFPKLASKKIYQDMTIRNVNTVQKLLGFLDEL